MSRLWRDGERSGIDRRGGREAALLGRLRQEGIRPAALGLSYSRAGRLPGCSKGSLCQWVSKEALAGQAVCGQVLELDGRWAHTRAGRVELKVLRDEQGAVALSFAGWEEVLDRLYKRGLQMPEHVVRDGDVVIAEALGLVYGPAVPHQLCQFHLPRLDPGEGATGEQ